jgi:LysM repeat protein
MRHLLGILIILSLFTAAVVIAQDSNDGVTLPITEDVTYRVRRADTLDAIGVLFDVSPSCIADMNNITDVRNIHPNDELLISVSCPLYGDDARDNVFMEVVIARDVVTYEDDCEGYRVQRNDSLDMIGFNFNMSMVAIAIENGIEAPYILELNQCLTIPTDAPTWGEFPAIQTVSGQPVDSDSLGQGGAGAQYVIQPYDTVDQVAQSFDISVVSIILANNISNTKILQPGTVIFIPSDAPPYGTYPAIDTPIPGLLYSVGEDDSLESIGEFFDVAVIAIQATNALVTDEDLVIGETIVIPYNAPAFGADANFDNSMLLGQGGGGETYVVQPLETIDQIAASYNVDTDCLLETNNIVRPYLVQPGRVLVIDQNCPPYTGYGIAPLSAVVSPANNDIETSPEPEATEEPAG